MSKIPEPTDCEHVIRAHQLCMDLNDFMMLINSRHDVREILHKTVEESCKALGCESARITMREGENWVIRYIKGFPDELTGRTFTDEELPHASLAMTTKKPVAIDDAFHDMRTNTEMMKALGMKSVLVVPLMEKSVVIGTLLFGYHSRMVCFTDTEIEYAEKVSTGVAIALTNARLYEELKRSESELQEAKKLGDVLNNIDNILHSARGHNEIMNEMLKMAAEVIGAETAIIFSKEEDRWMTRYVYNMSESLVGRSFSNSEVLHTVITAGTKRAIAIPDAYNSQDVQQEFVRAFGIRSLLDFPLIVKGEVIGDLTFHYHSSPVPFSERQVEFVGKLQNSISLALENARLLDAGKQSESRLKEAEKLGKFGYFHYDRRTRKIIWSEGVFSIFGRDPLLGEPTVEELFELYSIDPGREAMTELVGKEEVSEFDARITRDGTTYIHIVVRSLKDEKGAIVARFGTVQDISERKRAEDALRQSEQRFVSFMSHVPAAAWMKDLQGRYVYANAEAERVFSKPWLELAGKTDEEVFPTETARIFVENDRRVLDEGGSIVTTEILPQTDWIEHYSVVSRFAMPGFNGNQAYIGGVAFDITERKQAEEVIKRLNAELKAWSTELEASNRELEAFTYSVSHDLRQPLNIVSGYSQLINEVCGGQLPDQCKSYVRTIYEAALRMNKLIDALLTFSRLPRAEVHREDIDICGLAKSVFDEVRLTEPDRRVEFQLSEGIRANGDASLLRIVLENLIGNAWKYTRNQQQAVIEFGKKEVEGTELYFIRDNGVGFEMAYAEKLFIPFERLPGTDEFRGHGIGLATVERIIKRHGGKIWAEGEPGKGATFYFTLSAGGIK